MYLPIGWLIIFMQHCKTLCDIETGIVSNYNLKENLIEKGWTQCYFAPYGQYTSIDTLISLCINQTHIDSTSDLFLFIGALPTPSSIAAFVGAKGPSTVLTHYTQSLDRAYFAPTSTIMPATTFCFYNYHSRSFGFAPRYVYYTSSGRTIYTNYCKIDVDANFVSQSCNGINTYVRYADRNDVCATNRLSWRVDQPYTGGRAGSFWTEDSTVWHKVIYYKYCGPTQSPTPSPTLIPTFNTQNPTLSPSPSPTSNPTSTPTTAPILSPTDNPTFAPVQNPTFSPSIITQFPTIAPTISPITSPTDSPQLSPTLSPTFSPTFSPTITPTFSPTFSPTITPTFSPTFSPTITPTLSPTSPPTFSPFRWLTLMGYVCGNLANSKKIVYEIDISDCIDECMSDMDCVSVYYVPNGKTLTDSRCYVFDTQCNIYHTDLNAQIVIRVDQFFCEDYPIDWRDIHHDQCYHYVEYELCSNNTVRLHKTNAVLSYSDMHYGYDASQVCCDCGGGVEKIQNVLVSFEFDIDKISILNKQNILCDWNYGFNTEWKKWDNLDLFNLCYKLKQKLYEKHINDVDCNVFLDKIYSNNTEIVLCDFENFDENDGVYYISLFANNLNGSIMKMYLNLDWFSIATHSLSKNVQITSYTYLECQESLHAMDVFYGIYPCHINGIDVNIPKTTKFTGTTANQTNVWTTTVEQNNNGDIEHHHHTTKLMGDTNFFILIGILLLILIIGIIIICLMIIRRRRKNGKTQIYQGIDPSIQLHAVQNKHVSVNSVSCSSAIQSLKDEDVYGVYS
eukprot:392672_1